MVAVMDILELYYDHYKETYSTHQKTKIERDRYYLILCALEAFSFYLAIQPDQAATVISSGIKGQLNATITIGQDILQTLTWILIAYVLISYCRDCLYVERQYRYLDKLEKEISNIISKRDIFNREGDDYLKDYPIVLNLTDIFYKIVSPIMFSVINYIRIKQEIMQYGYFDKVSVTCDIVIFIMICIILWFFFFEIHSTTTQWLKRKIPFLVGISKFIHRILKEV